jgi:hypothetical protein
MRPKSRPSPGTLAGSVDAGETPSFGIAEEGIRLTMKQVKRAYPKAHEFDAGRGQTARTACLRRAKRSAASGAIPDGFEQFLRNLGARELRVAIDLV